MGISIDPTLPNRDWSGMVRPSLEAIVKLITKDYFGAAFKAHDASKELRTKAETLEQRVWTLWRESLAIALPEFFVTAALTRQPDDEELGRLLADILDESEAVAKEGWAQFEDVHIRTPTEFPLYPSLREKLSVWARTVAPEHLRDDERLRERLDRAFERGFRRAFADRGEHFSQLHDYFAGAQAETDKRRDAWRRYYEGLTREIEETPLFNQPEDGSGATLAKIFQPLRCYWRERPEQSLRDQADGEAAEIIHFAWLQSELEIWLDKQSANDALRVVTGGPGSGKSSSALWFARDVGYAGSVNVFVIRLQGLDVDQPIDAIVDQFADVAGTDHGMLEASPLGWLRDDSKPLLLVFDGLDEVARPDGAGLEVTKNFLRALHIRLGQANRGLRARLMALVLGRPQAAEEAAQAMGGSLENRALLYVAPLCQLYKIFLSRGGCERPVFKDPSRLGGEDFRAVFYERYRPFDKHCDEEGAPTALEDNTFLEITIEPLLLYLLIISGYAGKGWLTAKENRNYVYLRIFQDIHARDLRKPAGHPSKMGVEDEKDFLSLMECLGLAAWHGGGRSGTEEDFAAIRDRIYFTKQSHSLSERKSTDLKNVAVQTFTYKGDNRGFGYAFVHKSFGEYLAARAMLEAGEKWLVQHQGDSEAFVADFFQLAGRVRLTHEIWEFMVNEAKLRISEPADGRHRVDALASVAGHIHRHGFPAHGVLMASGSDTDWRKRESFQKNAEEALYALIHVWATASYPFKLLYKERGVSGWEPGPVKVEFSEGRGVADMFWRLRNRDGDEAIVNWLFQRWNLGEADLCGADLRRINLCGADLRLADLREVNFHGADLRGSALIGANLEEAKLTESDLRGAVAVNSNLSRSMVNSAKLSNAVLVDSNISWSDLRGSVCSEANFCRAMLAGANMRGIILKGAILREAALNGADLREGFLQDAKLHGADLTCTDLRGANLIGANLCGANCSQTRLELARLQSADLSGTINLTREQINNAEGNAKTLLPFGIQRPAHWLDDD
ncbi:MAG: pentapeptide repeat-containing protein [Alphaproteobacteria bacterium]